MGPNPVCPRSERAVLLSTLPAGARQRRLALAVVSVSAVFFAIAARHGGDVWADGRMGEGATFGFWLPDQGQPPETHDGLRQEKYRG